MSEIELQFADDENGDPIKVPRSTAKIVVKRHKPGQSGAPGRIHANRKQFTVAPDAPADVLAVLPADCYRLQPYDGKGDRVGEPFYVEIIHLDPVPEQSAAPAPTAKDAERERFYEELRQERQELRAMVKDSHARFGQLVDKVLQTMVKIAEAMPQAVESSASVVTASRGAGFSEMAEYVQNALEAAPDGGSNLETVLNSPVVVGAAAALQKYMAQAAQNGAEAMVARNGGGGETMAQRAARLAAQANKNGKARKN